MIGTTVRMIGTTVRMIGTTVRMIGTTVRVIDAVSLASILSSTQRTNLWGALRGMLRANLGVLWGTQGSISTRCAAAIRAGRMLMLQSIPQPSLRSADPPPRLVPPILQPVPSYFRRSGLHRPRRGSALLCLAVEVDRVRADRRRLFAPTEGRPGECRTMKLRPSRQTMPRLNRGPPGAQTPNETAEGQHA